MLSLPLLAHNRDSKSLKHNYMHADHTKYFTHTRTM